MTLGGLLAALFRPRSRTASAAFAFEADWAALLAQFNLPATALRDVVEADSLHPHFHYRHFTRPKRDGGRRELAAPDSKLKLLQQEIIRRYFAGAEVHPAAVAYRANRSTADHAWAHAGAAVLVTADVQDFFPSTSAWRVAAWWRERVEDDDLTRLLTRLTTYRGGLPQGAPTSPGLSNFVNRELDERLTERAALVGAKYTRYCDDLAFSWPREPGPPSDFEQGVRATLHEFGYTLHAEKGWCVYLREDEPELVGLVLTRGGRVRVPDEVRAAMRSLAGSADPRAAARLAGYKGYEKMVGKRPKRKKQAQRQRVRPRDDDVPF